MATARTHNNVTPNGLPKIKPAMMPMVFVLVTLCIQSVPTTMPVFANANIGKMTKATGLCKKSSSLWEGDSRSLSLEENGMARQALARSFHRWPQQSEAVRS